MVGLHDVRNIGPSTQFSFDLSIEGTPDENLCSFSGYGLCSIQLACICSKQSWRSGDAAITSASKKPSDTTGMAPSKSGSGTSTSGGSDANGDQGRDTMPNSSKSVMPLDKQNKPEK
jgi:hypothetical protein